MHLFSCSWPGKYETETAWEDLVQRSRDGEITAAVVFLPDGSTNFGNHQASSANENAECWCVDLYSERKPWRCYWRHLWISNIEKAVRNGALLDVYLFRRLARKRQGFCLRETAGPEHLQHAEILKHLGNFRMREIQVWRG